jgi:recombination protein RecT
MSTLNQNQLAPKTKLETIKDGLMSQGAIALFKDNLPNATGKQAEEMARRFAKMTYTAICQNPSLQDCSISSIVRAASISASLDLDIDPRGLAYLVPYKNNKTNSIEAQFQIGYLGLMELAYRSGKIKAISAHCVYESEKGKIEIMRIDGRYTVKHPFSYEPPTGKIIAVYASAEIEGLGPQTIVLRTDEVEKFRKSSKAPNSPAWTNFPEAMYKKTAIRQLAKFLPKSILEDFSKGAAIDEQETFVEAATATQSVIEGQAGSQVINADFEKKIEKPKKGGKKQVASEDKTIAAPSSNQKEQPKPNFL